MTADHLRPLVEHASLSAVFGQAAGLLAQNKVPEEVMDVLRCGWLMALKKRHRGGGRDEEGCRSDNCPTGR